MSTEINGVVPESLILVERHSGYAVITLNRPEKRNAMNVAAQAELTAALADLRDDCRAIVLTGAGTVSFCAGVDLKERRGMSDQAGTRLYAWESDSWFNVQEAILKHPSVFIAAVNGTALGGGLTLVNSCEIAVAAETSTFGMPEIGFGTFPALSGATSLHRILPKHAAYMILTGERIDAHTAERWGLINEVTEAASLLPRAIEIAETIATKSAVAVDFSKKAVREIPALGWSESIDYGLRTGMVIRANSDIAKANVARFLQTDD